MRLRPKQNWQLLKDSTCAFWWDGRLFREGVAGRVSYCSLPQCSCTSVQVSGMTMSDYDHSVTIMESSDVLSEFSFRRRCALDGERLRLDLDIELSSGSVTPRPLQDCVSAEAVEVARRIESSFDSDLLDELHARLSVSKGDPLVAAPSFEAIGSVDPQQVFAYETVFPKSRHEVVTCDGQQFDVVDFYDPAIPSDIGAYAEVAVYRTGSLVCSFLLYLDGERDWIEEDRYEIDTARGFSEDAAKAVGAAFVRRTPRSRMRRRFAEFVDQTSQLRTAMEWQRLQSLQQEPIRSENRVGRNEPCPCGSGKKFKKCCLRAIG